MGSIREGNPLRPLLFQRPTRPKERAAWLSWMLALALARFIAERAPKVRKEIAETLVAGRRFRRSFCAGCRHFPGEDRRLGEKPFDDIRPCLAGHEMHFHIPDDLYPTPETVGWRREDCPDREKGEAPPEPPLPPKPWFRLSRQGGRWYAVLVDHGESRMRREIGDHPTKADARAAATAWARRQGLQYVEERQRLGGAQPVFVVGR